jgi:hypothetical protein
MPVRWALYHPQDSHFALLATETGVWQCADIYQQSVIWLPVNTGMANVRVDMLQLRKADNTILAATHGRGFFTMTWDVTTGREEPGVSALRVYPNPARNTLTIQTGCAGGGVNRMRITDMTGREVFSAEIDPEKEGTGRQADISSLKSGVYLIVLESAEKRILTEKLIVNHH